MTSLPQSGFGRPSRAFPEVVRSVIVANLQGKIQRLTRILGCIFSCCSQTTARSCRVTPGCRKNIRHIQQGVLTTILGRQGCVTPFVDKLLRTISNIGVAEVDRSLNDLFAIVFTISNSPVFTGT